MPPPNRNPRSSGKPGVNPSGGKPAGGKPSGGLPAGKKAGGDPSIRRRKQVARKYGQAPFGQDRHDDGGRGDDFHDDRRESKRPVDPRGAGERPGGPRRTERPTGARGGAGRPAPRTEAPRPAPRPEMGDETVRLNRFIARAGIAARREADAIIQSGRVQINGTVVTEMGVQVGPRDRVTVDGRPVGPVGLVYILMNKPTGVVTTTSDERGRRTVMDLLDLPPSESDGLFPVGRLDRNTSGALLFTTDGDLAHRLMHPRYETIKHYLCQAERPLTDDDLDQLLAGVTLEDGVAKADNVQFVGPDARVIAIGLHEGRNRQVRRMIEALGTRVEALERVGYAGLTLEGLRKGKWRRLSPHEVNALRRKVKLKAIVYDSPSR